MTKVAPDDTPLVAPRPLACPSCGRPMRQYNDDDYECDACGTTVVAPVPQSSGYDPDSLAAVQYAGYLAFAAFTIRQLILRAGSGILLTEEEIRDAEQVAEGLDRMATDCRA